METKMMIGSKSFSTLGTKKISYMQIKMDIMKYYENHFSLQKVKTNISNAKWPYFDLNELLNESWVAIDRQMLLNRFHKWMALALAIRHGFLRECAVNWLLRKIVDISGIYIKCHRHERSPGVSVAWMLHWTRYRNIHKQCSGSSGKHASRAHLM